MPLSSAADSSYDKPDFSYPVRNLTPEQELFVTEDRYYERMLVSVYFLATPVNALKQAADVLFTTAIEAPMMFAKAAAKRSGTLLPPPTVLAGTVVACAVVFVGGAVVDKALGTQPEFAHWTMFFHCFPHLDDPFWLSLELQHVTRWVSSEIFYIPENEFWTLLLGLCDWTSVYGSSCDPKRRSDGCTLIGYVWDMPALEKAPKKSVFLGDVEISPDAIMIKASQHLLNGLPYELAGRNCQVWVIDLVTAINAYLKSMEGEEFYGRLKLSEALKPFHEKRGWLPAVVVNFIQSYLGRSARLL